MEDFFKAPPPVPIDIYERIRKLEDRALALEDGRFDAYVKERYAKERERMIIQEKERILAEKGKL